MSSAYFEIKLDNVVRTHRDQRGTAIETARFVQRRNPNATIVITDLRDGLNLSFKRTRHGCGACRRLTYVSADHE